MFQLDNRTKFCAERAVQLDKAGNQIWVVIIKATYLINKDGKPELHQDQEPVCMAPVYLGEPGKSSLLRESEIVSEHPGTDIILNATAYAPGDKPLQTLDVSVTVGQIQKTLLLFGDRYWEKGIVGLKISRPEPFKTMPIIYERAYGGTEASNEKEGKQEFEPRNPIGRGFATNSDSLVGKLLPNIEEPNDLSHSWKSRPQPAGFGAILSAWSPRKEYAGTYDDDWINNRMPLWPVDYDPRFNQSAHPALISSTPLRSGERVSLKNLTSDSILSFELPRLYLTIDTLVAKSRLRQRVQLDRVIIEPDFKKLIMVWRSSLNCGSNIRQIKETVIDTKEYIR